jgi:Tfp pilus tip-associated adhesin PilY1
MILLDGMLIAKDVDYFNQTKTLLTGYLGHGGNGFYTMDISKMDGANKAPVFEWAIENARYGEDGPFDVDEYIKLWGKAESSLGNYDYTDLGLTLVPGVCLTPVGGSNNDNTIGVLPGGLGHRIGADSQGKAFYFFNPTDGSIIKTIDSNSNASTGFDAPVGRKLGMGITPVVYHENSENKAVAFYTADSEGNIMKCDLEESNRKLKSIFQLRTLGNSLAHVGSGYTVASQDLPVAIPKKLVLAKSRNSYMWVFGGTSDLFAPGSDAYEYRRLINKEQFIFGVNVDNVYKADEMNHPGINAANANVRKLTYYRDGMPSKYGNYGVPYVFDDELGIRHGVDDYGWVLRLRPKVDDAGAEYLSADPYLMNSVLYVATFIPYEGASADEACSDIGVAKLYALDPSTGHSIMPNKSAITMENLKIAGLTGNPTTNRLVLSIKELTPGAAGREIFGNFSNVVDISSTRSLFEVGAPNLPYNLEENDPERSFEPLVPIVQYWRERF